MLSKEEKLVLDKYVNNLATMPANLKIEYLTLPVVDIQWLVDKCEELNEECEALRLRIDQLEGKA